MGEDLELRFDAGLNSSSLACIATFPLWPLIKTATTNEMYRNFSFLEQFYKNPNNLVQKVNLYPFSIPNLEISLTSTRQYLQHSSYNWRSVKSGLIDSFLAGNCPPDLLFNDIRNRNVTDLAANLRSYTQNDADPTHFNNIKVPSWAEQISDATNVILGHNINSHHNIEYNASTSSTSTSLASDHESTSKSTIPFKRKPLPLIARALLSLSDMYNPFIPFLYRQFQRHPDPRQRFKDDLMWRMNEFLTVTNNRLSISYEFPVEKTVNMKFDLPGYTRAQEQTYTALNNSDSMKIYHKGIKINRENLYNLNPTKNMDPYSQSLEETIYDSQTSHSSTDLFFIDDETTDPRTSPLAHSSTSFPPISEHLHYMDEFFYPISAPTKKYMSFSYSLANRLLEGLSPYDSFDLLRDTGYSTKSSFLLSYTNDSRDNSYSPSKGNMFSWFIDAAGLLPGFLSGDSFFIKGGFDYQFHFPLFSSYSKNTPNMEKIVYSADDPDIQAVWQSHPTSFPNYLDRLANGTLPDDAYIPEPAGYSPFSFYFASSAEAIIPLFNDNTRLIDRCFMGGAGTLMPGFGDKSIGPKSGLHAIGGEFSAATSFGFTGPFRTPPWISSLLTRLSNGISQIIPFHFPYFSPTFPTFWAPPHLVLCDFIRPIFYPKTSHIISDMVREDDPIMTKEILHAEMANKLCQKHMDELDLILLSDSQMDKNSPDYIPPRERLENYEIQAAKLSILEEKSTLGFSPDILERAQELATQELENSTAISISEQSSSWRSHFRWNTGISIGNCIPWPRSFFSQDAKVPGTFPGSITAGSQPLSYTLWKALPKTGEAQRIFDVHGANSASRLGATSHLDALASSSSEFVRNVSPVTGNYLADFLTSFISTLRLSANFGISAVIPRTNTSLNLSWNFPILRQPGDNPIGRPAFSLGFATSV